MTSKSPVDPSYEKRLRCTSMRRRVGREMQEYVALDTPRIATTPSVYEPLRLENPIPLAVDLHHRCKIAGRVSQMHPGSLSELRSPGHSAVLPRRAPSSGRWGLHPHRHHRCPAAQPTFAGLAGEHTQHTLSTRIALPAAPHRTATHTRTHSPSISTRSISLLTRTHHNVHAHPHQHPQHHAFDATQSRQAARTPDPPVPLHEASVDQLDSSLRPPRHDALGGIALQLRRRPQSRSVPRALHDAFFGFGILLGEIASPLPSHSRIWRRWSRALTSTHPALLTLPSHHAAHVDSAPIAHTAVHARIPVAPHRPPSLRRDIWIAPGRAHVLPDHAPCAASDSTRPTPPCTIAPTSGPHKRRSACICTRTNPDSRTRNRTRTLTRPRPQRDRLRTSTQGGALSVGDCPAAVDTHPLRLPYASVVPAP
ncbi:hypothetical protein C8R45DRAFT_1103895 [Mycena sanguinolenta]|nr:hypothetical protein C8R45DRAFT_1103895 [Mycena sanguinolenta]